MEKTNSNNSVLSGHSGNDLVRRPFRAPIQPRELDNLVLAGSGTHPGVGVPLVLISGQLAAERVLRLVGHGGRHDG
jgi:phytoene dehydrogenase-like protein